MRQGLTSAAAEVLWHRALSDRGNNSSAPGEVDGEFKVFASKVPLEQVVQVGVPHSALGLQPRDSLLLHPLQRPRRPVR